MLLNYQFSSLISENCIAWSYNELSHQSSLFWKKSFEYHFSHWTRKFSTRIQGLRQQKKSKLQTWTTLQKFCLIRAYSCNPWIWAQQLNLWSYITYCILCCEEKICKAFKIFHNFRSSKLWTSKYSVNKSNWNLQKCNIFETHWLQNTQILIMIGNSCIEYICGIKVRLEVNITAGNSKCTEHPQRKIENCVLQEM